MDTHLINLNMKIFAQKKVQSCLDVIMYVKHVEHSIHSTVKEF